MTKPQALPFLLPFAAWFWAHGGWREIAPDRRRSALAVIVVLWLPFIPAGRTANYLHNLGDYQGDIFPYLSLNAWNVWWLIQTQCRRRVRFRRRRSFSRADHPATASASLVTGLLSLVVALAHRSRPTPRTFILGLAASTLISFTFLTQMHERYAFGAVIFLLLLIPERRIHWLYLAFSVVFTLNLLVGHPAGARSSATGCPYPGLQSIVGAVVMIAITLVSILWLGSGSRRGADAGAPDPRAAVPDGAASA